MTDTDDTLPSSTSSSSANASTAAQKHNPLHGLTLETILNELVAFFGWEDLGQRIDIRCFVLDPSVVSSLKFLRKTPWARTKVESLYLFMKREQIRQQRASQPQQPTAPTSQVHKPAIDPDEPVFTMDSPARTIAVGEAVADADGSADDVEE